VNQEIHAKHAIESWRWNRVDSDLEVLHQSPQRIKPGQLHYRGDNNSIRRCKSHHSDRTTYVITKPPDDLDRQDCATRARINQ